MPIITLTTDFGTGSPYVAAMKGVILSINPAATIVDISHAVPAQDIARGALVLEDTTPWFPADTIHVAVVDPGVGTERAILYARIGPQQYIAPDNGLLSRLMARTPPSLVLRLTEREYWLPEVSHTFHGRDIMAPVAARLSLGLDPAAARPGRGAARSARLAAAAGRRREDPRRGDRDRFLRQPDHEHHARPAGRPAQRQPRLRRLRHLRDLRHLSHLRRAGRRGCSWP